jgi:Glycosyl hydrolases family 16
MKKLLLSIVAILLMASASAPLGITITSPTSGSTVSGTITVTATVTSPGSDYTKWYVPNPPSNGNCAFGTYDSAWNGCSYYDVTSFSYNTALVPNGSPFFGVQLINPTTLQADATSIVTFTVSNAGGPTPTASASPTSAPTPTPSGSLLPYGNIAPPAGTSWNVIYDDEFVNDSIINTGLWNAALSGGQPMCYPNGTPASTCQSAYPPSETITDCLGYDGSSNCNPGFTGTQNGHAYGETVVPGTGLEIQPYPAPYTDPFPTYGAGQYMDNIWAGIQNYGKWPTTIYGYFEWYAKLPTDVSGEGDGYHTDLWCTTNNRFDEGNASQVDVSENIAGPNNHTTTSFNVCQGPPDDNCTGGQTYSAPDRSDLTQTFHHYGLYWSADPSSTFGYMTLYVDGVQTEGPVAVNVADWGNGIFCFAGWAQADIGSNQQGELNGNALSANTSYNDPLVVQYFRAWQSATPAPSQPTPSPTATPPSSASGGFVALIGGGIIDSSFVIDAGFFTAAYGFPPAAETYLYYQINPYQQFMFAPSGNDYTICNVQNGACLTDGGAVVDIGQGTDTWAVTQSGAGWTLQDTRTGQFMGAIPTSSESNIPMSATAVTLSLDIIQ